MRTGIYAIYDNLAKAILGGLHLYKHDAAAIRFFSDIATTANTQINKHPSDFDLVRLGFLENEVELTPLHEVILTGANWLAAQQKQQEGQP